MKIAALTVALATTGAAAQPAPSVYDQNCSVCHQAGGAGVAGAFPRLSGRAGDLAALALGRTVMISAVLRGMAGKLTVDGQTIVGVMPAFPKLADEDVASVLTEVSRWGGKEPAAFTAAEVADVRASPKLTPSQVNALARDPAVEQAAP